MKILLASLFFAIPAFAEPPLLAHIDIVDGARESALALVVPPNGEPSELSVSGPVTTKIRLRRSTLGLEFDVEHIAADHTGFHARGEVPMPPVGKRVVVARVPRPSGGAAEVQLTLK
jgi:hypothetical protein